MVIGSIDAGKTTLTLLLANHAKACGKNVAVVDADMGQSEIGPPTTIGLGWVEKELEELSDATLRGLYFVGNTSPENKLLPSVIGAKKMVDKAFSLGADMVILDTTGLIQGDLGLTLKQKKIELINPDNVILIQHVKGSQNSGEFISRFLKVTGGTMEIVPAHPESKSRPPEERKARREEKFKRYFQDSRTHTISLQGISTSGTVLGSGRMLNNQERESLSKTMQDTILYAEEISKGLLIVTVDKLEDKTLKMMHEKLRGERLIFCTLDDFKHFLLSFEDQSNESLGLGIVTDLHLGGRKIIVSTPVDAGRIKDARCLRFGRIRFDYQAGKELNTVEPLVLHEG
jgi:polynucleotide 5'-hydroxyl-kinase GRC3/NOL9